MKKMFKMMLVAAIMVLISGGHLYAMDQPMQVHGVDKHKMDHSMSGEMKHDMGMKMKEGMEHDEGMKMSEGMDMKVLNIDGFKLTFHIMDMPAYHKMMKNMGMDHSHMDHAEKNPGATHNIMVDITDSKGDRIKNATVKLKTINPLKESEEKKLEPMMGYYVSSFDMLEEGKYQIMTLFKVGKDKHKGGFWHEMK